jgi:hypothetical protein
MNSELDATQVAVEVKFKAQLWDLSGWTEEEPVNISNYNRCLVKVSNQLFHEALPLEPTCSVIELGNLLAPLQNYVNFGAFTLKFSLFQIICAFN